MKRYYSLIWFWVFAVFGAYASQDSVQYRELDVHGKLINIGPKYHRVDTAKYHDMPPAVKRLYTNSAGLFVHFRTNASEVYAKWCVTEKKMNLNLTAIANKGLDVYIKNKAGRWQYAGSKGTDKVCEENKLVERLDTTTKEFLVYLPLYDEVKSLQIGVSSGFLFEELPNPFTKKTIAVYGSSIVHGASASRAGMTYPAIMSRNTGFNFINLGVSGNARIEKEVAHMLGDSSPDLFILDCVPNSSPEQVTERTQYFVEYLQKKHPTVPIIMIPTVVRELSYFNTYWGTRNQNQNLAWKEQFELLKSKGMKNLYYLDTDNLLGDDHEGTTDGVHPSDLGFMRMVAEIQPFVMEVLNTQP